MGDNAKTWVRYEIWYVYRLDLQVVKILLYLNGYCLRGTNHLHDLIFDYCKNRKGVLKTLSFVCLSSCICLGANARFLSFNRTQSRAVTGLLTRHNTLRRHLHLMGLSDSPLCWRCGAEDETSAHILCECEALASLRHVYLGSFLEQQDIKSISLGPYGTLVKQQVSHKLIWGTMGLLIKASAHWNREILNPTTINWSVIQLINPWINHFLY
jgi:hypothetical protein